jgi:hypothetical protein
VYLNLNQQIDEELVWSVKGLTTWVYDNENLLLSRNIWGFVLE